MWIRVFTNTLMPLNLKTCLVNFKSYFHFNPTFPSNVPETWKVLKQIEAFLRDMTLEMLSLSALTLIEFKRKHIDIYSVRCEMECLAELEFFQPFLSCRMVKEDCFCRRSPHIIRKLDCCRILGPFEKFGPKNDYT